MPPDGDADAGAGHVDAAGGADEHPPLDVIGGQAALAQQRQHADALERRQHRGVNELAAELAPEVRVALQDSHRDAVRDELVRQHHPGRAGADDQDLRRTDSDHEGSVSAAPPARQAEAAARHGPDH